MIATVMIAGLLMLAQYGYGAPPSSSAQGSSSGGIDTAPFVQLQRKCFDKAVSETQGAAQEMRQQRYDACFGLHDAMIKHATAKLSENEAATAKRDIDRALGGVEKSYAKKLGVPIPGEQK